MTPNPTEIRAARLAAGLTQAQAAAIIHKTYRAWMEWEAGNRALDPVLWHVWQYWARHKAAPVLKRKD
jgi:DNA-binding XRE family transcriptional regulator